MKYIVSFNVKKGYADIEVEADSQADAEDIAWIELMNMTIGELHKFEADYDCEVAE